MKKPELILYYDGDCPICSRYRDYVAIRQVYDLELRDARQHLTEVRALADRGFDINTGMILVTPDGTLQGANAVVAMRAFTKGRGVGDGAFRLLLKAPWLVRFGYPFARGLRHLLLKATGRSTRVELEN
jgi:predicted DCC family thiol-disulfide oxidoreductase YuxK